MELGELGGFFLEALHFALCLKTWRLKCDEAGKNEVKAHVAFLGVDGGSSFGNLRRLISPQKVGFFRKGKWCFLFVRKIPGW